MGYDPGERYAQERAIREVVDQIASGLFSPSEPDRHRPIVQALLQTACILLVAGKLAREL